MMQSLNMVNTAYNTIVMLSISCDRGYESALTAMLRGVSLAQQEVIHDRRCF